MSNLQVLFQVPEAIETGLATGQFERIGGVIVERSSKQIVTWLRDGAVVANTSDLGNIAGAAGRLLPSGQIFNIAGAAATLFDGHKTRQAIGLLQNQVQTLTTLTMTGQVVNLAVSAASFRAIKKRLDLLSDEIKTLSEQVQAEFNRDRMVSFDSALQRARDALESDNSDNARHAAYDAQEQLYKARKNFIIDFENSLKNTPTKDKLIAAQHHLIHAIYAEISRIRSYLEVNELKMAKDRLQESLEEFKTYIIQLINLWIGDYPSIYFHKSILSDDLTRFLHIQQWLRTGSFSPDDASFSLFETIDNMRQDFWSNEVVSKSIGNGNVLNPVTRIKKSQTRKQRLAQLADNLLQAELLIENYRRMEGFEYELRTMRLSGDRAFTEWSNLVSEDDLEKHGVALIVDQEILERLSL